MTLSRFERMVAIPEEEYQHLKTLQQSRDPLESKFQSLTSDYQKQGTIPNVHTRNQRQGETLNEMVKLKDDLRKRLIQSTPKAYQSRSQSLFHFIENKLALNEKGEVLDKDGTIIHGSNIADLVQHAVRDRRRNIVPAGWEHFLNMLRETNAPRMIMNYDTLEELQAPGSKRQTSSPIKFTAAKPSATVASVKSEGSQQSPTRKVSKRDKKRPSYLKDYFAKDAKRLKSYI